VLTSTSAWLPGYLEIQRHLDIPLPPASSPPFPSSSPIAGAVLRRWSADLLDGGGFSSFASRKIPIIIGLLGLGGFTFLALYAERQYRSGKHLRRGILPGGSGRWDSRWQRCGGRRTARVRLAAIQNFGNYIGAAMAPMFITGFIVQGTGGDFTHGPGAGGVLGAGFRLRLVPCSIVPSRPVSGGRNSGRSRFTMAAAGTLMNAAGNGFGQLER